MHRITWRSLWALRPWDDTRTRVIEEEEEEEVAGDRVEDR